MNKPRQVHYWGSYPPTIDMERLLGVHKYKDMSKVRPVVRDAAQKAVILAGQYSKPQAAFTTIGIQGCDDDGIELVNGTRLNCKAFAGKLGASNQLVVFLITLGPTLDSAVSKGFSDGSDPLAPLFLDTGGWLMIEAATRDFSRYLKEEHFGRRHKLSIRMAPGYSYRITGQSERSHWDLLEQEKLFGLFPGADLPVELMESGAMLPRMSRSGVFGVELET